MTRKREKEVMDKKELMPIFCFITYIQEIFIHPVSEKTYEILTKLCKDEFNVPVAAKAAVVKFSQANRKFTWQGNMLLYNRKKVRYYI